MPYVLTIIKSIRARIYETTYLAMVLELRRRADVLCHHRAGASHRATPAGIRARRRTTGVAQRGGPAGVEGLGSVFGRSTEKRWAWGSAVHGQSAKAMLVQAPRAGRGAQRVHENVPMLTRPVLVERSYAARE